MSLAIRYAGIQDKLKNIDKYGCHFLTLCSIAEEANQLLTGNKLVKVDLIDAINLAISKNLINEDYEVQNNCGLLNFLTSGHTWAQTTVKILPNVIKSNQFTEVVFYNDRTKFKHYRRRSVDTLFNSTTVKEGYVLEYRIYTVN